MATPGEKTWVEINSAALRSNIEALRSILNPESKFCATVKANAYGHDIETIVRLAKIEGVEHFAVDSVDEAITARKVAPEAQIFILGHTVPEHFEDIVTHNLIQTIYDEQSLNQLADIASRMQSRALANIKIETGTNRQGIREFKLPDLLRAARRHERFVQIVGVSSHFCDAENVEDQNLLMSQLANFDRALNTIHATDFSPPYIHIACSAAAMLEPKSHFTMARYGIAMYGLWSSKALEKKMKISGKVDLSPIMSLKTRIAQIKDIPAGDYVGYSRSFRSDRPIRIAVLPIGYYDGFRRAYQGADVLIQGQRCKNIGNICMNMFMVDVSNVPRVNPGDTVTLLGRDGMHQITADELGDRTGTINYEVVTAIGAHLPRIVI
ncbi:MAG: alanine racemase [Candidatus Uhrbacteria bacterium]|nr:alanine racemase [Candidatus Uhrbacteria bacterium]